jgi:hypothetical protein
MIIIVVAEGRSGGKGADSCPGEWYSGLAAPCNSVLCDILMFIINEMPHILLFPNNDSFFFLQESREWKHRKYAIFISETTEMISMKFGIGGQY